MSPEVFVIDLKKAVRLNLPKESVVNLLKEVVRLNLLKEAMGLNLIKEAIVSLLKEAVRLNLLKEAWDCIS